jgi:hypothetical protein
VVHNSRRGFFSRLERVSMDLPLFIFITSYQAESEQRCRVKLKRSWTVFATLSLTLHHPLILEIAAVSTHLAQPLDSSGISGESLITNKVMAISPDTPDKSRNYTMHELLTAVSRLMKVMNAT